MIKTKHLSITKHYSVDQKSDQWLVRYTCAEPNQIPTTCNRLQIVGVQVLLKTQSIAIFNVASKLRAQTGHHPP